MQDTLKRIFADLFGLDETEISPELNPETVELWDSLNHLRMVTALEESFDIKLSMAEIEAMMSSFGQLQRIVEKHLSATRA